MDSDPQLYRVRRLLPEDAQAIPGLTEAVNGPGYIHAEVYHPAALLRMNESGERLSVVALHEEAGVVGHYALERPDLGLFAETGEAMVLPAHQHHHLLDRMRVLLEEEAARIDLIGIYGNAVTHHVYSQKMEELFKAVPTGFRLGSAPAAAHRLENFPQRISLVTYFKYLRRPGALRVHIPAHHQQMAVKIFAALGRKVEVAPASEPAPVALTIESSFETSEQQATVTIRRGGSHTISDLENEVASHLANGDAEVVFVEIPLADPAAPALCAALEARGFFFCGIEPRDEEEGDLMHMQKLMRPLDLALVQTVDDLARELLGYIGSERERVSASK
ncbi:MAG TPA: hypothetical protein VMA09_20415 [Candidatus Binataceae bacterium]|nr:hypothetical protein [Candidatus Binataceae bacterium]